MSTVIGAPRERVWDALTVPAELARWDPRVLSIREGPTAALADGDCLVARYRLGAVPVDYTLRVLSAAPTERLDASVAVGLFRFRETAILADESRTQTRLSLRLAAPNAMPVVGGVIDRFDVRKMAAERVDERLHALRIWCESTPPVDGPFAHGSPA